MKADHKAALKTASTLNEAQYADWMINLATAYRELRELAKRCIDPSPDLDLAERNAEALRAAIGEE